MKTFTLETDAFTKKYDYLWRLSDDRWAWEYARRNQKLRQDAAACCREDIDVTQADCANIRLLRSRVPQTLAERWGLVFMPDPRLDALEADVVWSNHAFPDQVEIHCATRADGETCGIWERTVPYCSITHVTAPHGREYFLVRGKGCVVQVRCTGHTLLGLAPIRMKLTISDVDAYEKRLKIQQEAMRIFGDGPDTQAPLWTKRTQILRNGLIALDCLKAGLTRREIAEVLYGRERVAEEWNGPSLKHTMRYLILKAEGLRDGGYLVELLGSQRGLNRSVA